MAACPKLPRRFERGVQPVLNREIPLTVKDNVEAVVPLTATLYQNSTYCKGCLRLFSKG